MKLFVGAKGLIARDDGKVLIVREGNLYEEGTELGNWDVVGGRIEPEEPLFEGLAREVTEESGLNVVVGQLLGVTENFPTIKGETVHIIRTYYACTTRDEIVKLSSDHDAYEWIDPTSFDSYGLMDDVKEMFKKYNALV
jgi:8-oxo-dGTP diphosphatase